MPDFTKQEQGNCWQGTGNWRYRAQIKDQCGEQIPCTVNKGTGVRNNQRTGIHARWQTEMPRYNSTESQREQKAAFTGKWSKWKTCNSGTHEAQCPFMVSAVSVV